MSVRAARNQFETVFTDLRSRSFRVTQPRRDIIAQFARTGRYVTARALHERLRVLGKNAGLATVYRTLEMLREIGVASPEAHGKGETAYLYCPPAHHHHAVCVKCGRVADIPCRSASAFARTLADTLRFRLSQHRLEFIGTCARCS